MNKCWARGGQHGKHMDLNHDLPTNYDQRYRGDILSGAEELNRIGLITIWPAGNRRAVAAASSEDAIKAALPKVNAYLSSVGEDPLEESIREIITGKRTEKKGPLSREELHKFARLRRRAQRK